MADQNIPSPAEIRARIQQGDKDTGAAILATCVQALARTNRMITNVEISQGTSEAGVVWAMRKLNEAGYGVIRHRGSQRDPGDSLQIDCYPG